MGRDSTVAEAMRAVPRAPFLPEDQRQWADQDRPLPTGHRSTNSQPTTVRTMLELLSVPAGGRVLDVGCGTGWTCALLAELTGESGTVTGVEIVPELVRWARENLADRPQVRVELAREGTIGWPDRAPYDRILVSADARSLPAGLSAQLAAGGRMVIPVRSRMTVVERTPEGELRQTETGGRYSFVPLR